MQASIGGSAVKTLPDNAGDTRDVGSTPGSGKSPGEGNGHPEVRHEGCEPLLDIAGESTFLL